jgi:peptidoglycan/LPS O-acetylase OafA/YrhL
METAMHESHALEIADSLAASTPRVARLKIAELDGLRGVAILLVFLTHFIAGYLAPTAVGIDGSVRAVARIGWTGVDLFFVLSGYLITGVLLDTKRHPGYWTNYAAKRCLRIFPLYFGVLILLFWIVPLTHWHDPDYATLRSNQAWYWTYLVNLLQAVKPSSATPMNTAHLWSLCVEEQFYFVWPFVVLYASRHQLVRIAGWAVALGLALRVALALGTRADAAYVLTPCRLDGLMAGAVLAVAARESGGLGRWRKSAMCALAAGCALLLPLAMWRGMEYSDPIIAVAGFPLLALCYGALLVLTLTADGWWARAMRRPALRSWGKYSYGLYLLHYPMLWAMDQKLANVWSLRALTIGGSQLPVVVLRATIGVPLAYAAAWLSYQLYERHFLALKRRFA